MFQPTCLDLPSPAANSLKFSISKCQSFCLELKTIFGVHAQVSSELIKAHSESSFMQPCSLRSGAFPYSLKDSFGEPTARLQAAASAAKFLRLDDSMTR